MRELHMPKHAIALLIVLAAACSRSTVEPSRNAETGNPTFDEVARSYLEDLYRRSPTFATYLGIHKYNHQLDDYSRAAVDDAIASARQFRERVASIDPSSLSPERQLDREQLLRAI